jgi:hypothetical protein
VLLRGSTGRTLYSDDRCLRDAQLMFLAQQRIVTSLSCTMPTVDKVLNIRAEELRVKLKIVSGLAFPGNCWWLRVCWYVPSILLISGATSASWSDLAFLRESSSMTH